MVPLLTLFTYLQLRRLQYCDACQRTVPRLRPLSEPEFCVRCGGSLRQ
jgi:rRNA maturation endonuclease Nob1